MVSSGLLRRVALVRTNVSEEPGASFIRVTKIGELGTVFLRNVRRLLVAACVVPSSPIFVTLMKEAPGSSETWFFNLLADMDCPCCLVVRTPR
jgi:hypothetical protein